MVYLVNFIIVITMAFIITLPARSEEKESCCSKIKPEIKAENQRPIGFLMPILKKFDENKNYQIDGEEVTKTKEFLIENMDKIIERLKEHVVNNKKEDKAEDNPHRRIPERAKERIREARERSNRKGNDMPERARERLNKANENREEFKSMTKEQKAEFIINRINQFGLKLKQNKDADKKSEDCK